MCSLPADTAQIVLDWSIDGTGPDGKHVHLGGSASDILRRGADGLWRYIIDNNQGTAVRQPAEIGERQHYDREMRGLHRGEAARGEKIPCARDDQYEQRGDRAGERS